MRDEERSVPSRSDNFAATTFFISSMLWNCLTLNLTHLRMPDPRSTPPLRDLGFDLIPILRLQWITDTMLIFFNGIVVVIWLYTSYVEGNVAKARQLWTKYFVVWGYCMLMRGCSIALTSLPATENHCQNPGSIDSIFSNTVMGFLTFGSGNVHCGDLMFSGHTTNILNAFWMVAIYGRKFPLLVVSSGLCVLMCLFLIIASRSHYTIDVYVAACITTLTVHATTDSLPFFLAPLSDLWATVVTNTPLPVQTPVARKSPESSYNIV